MNVVDMNTEELLDHLEKWQKDMISDFNSNFQGQSLHDTRVLAAVVDGLMGDVRLLIELNIGLLRRLKETKNEENK